MDLNTLNSYIEYSLSGNFNYRTEGEKYFSTIVLNSSTLEILFNFLLNNQIPQKNKKFLAVFIKNYVINYFTNDSDQSFKEKEKIMNLDAINYFKNSTFFLLQKIDDEDIAKLISAWIIEVYKVHKGYKLIWSDLIINLNGILSNNDFLINKRIYSMIAEFTNRYTTEIKSYRLFEEILDCMIICPNLTKDCNTYLSILLNLVSNKQYLNNVELQHEIRRTSQLITSIITISFNFNSQDFPEFYEDNLEAWITILLKSCNLIIYCPEIDEIIPLSTISLKMINKYFYCYFNDIKIYANNFIKELWQILENIDVSFIKFEPILAELIEFYHTCLQYKYIEVLQENELNIILNKLAYPNLKLSQADIEEYKADKVAFMKSEIEEIETNTSKLLINFQIKDLQLIYLK